MYLAICPYLALFLHLVIEETGVVVDRVKMFVILTASNTW